MTQADMNPFQTAGADCYDAASEHRGRRMKRREFISLLGSAAALWPISARAQIPLVGFVNSSSAQAQADVMAAYRRGLEESGFIEGKNVLIESRFANGQYDRLPELLGDLVTRKVAVIMAGGPPAAIAAKTTTSTIPIVFTSGDDPVQTGLVSSINRPGGNATGIYIFFSDVETKKLGLLRELVPNADLMAAMVNPSFPTANKQTQELHDAAGKLRQRIQIFNASNELEIDAAFALIMQVQASAMLVAADPFFASRRDQIVSLATKYAIPAVYEQRAFTTIGGLMSYGTNLPEGYRQAGIYTGRILKGEKPADLPVVLSNKFEFVINLKVAKALGLAVSANLLSTADEVLE